jgi:predicted ATPase
VRRGDAVAGVPLLRAALEGLRRARFEVPCSEFLSSLATALAASGNVTEGLATIDAVPGRVESIGESWFAPEALRLKGLLLLMRNESVDAENHFLRSLELAHRQGARSWELRTAVSLARLQRGQGRIREAHDRLTSIYSHFTEGFGTADLQAAKHLMNALARAI